MAWRLVIGLTLLVICAVTNAVPAQGTQPATATAPAVAAADPTTPKGTLKLLSTAMQHGDVRAMRELMLANEPLEQKMVAAQIAQAEAFARFRDALVNSFGQPALDELIGQAPTADQRNAVFDAAPEQIDGDRATITVEQDTYELRKVNGKWMLSLASMARSVEPVVLEESLRDMTLRSQVMREVADEIADGKYQNTDEVGQAIQGKLMVALMRNQSTTQPAATQPGN